MSKASALATVNVAEIMARVQFRCGMCFDILSFEKGPLLTDNKISKCCLKFGETEIAHTIFIASWMDLSSSHICFTFASGMIEKLYNHHLLHYTPIASEVFYSCFYSGCYFTY